MRRIPQLVFAAAMTACAIASVLLTAGDDIINQVSAPSRATGSSRLEGAAAAGRRRHFFFVELLFADSGSGRRWRSPPCFRSDISGWRDAALYPLAAPRAAPTDRPAPAAGFPF